MKVNNISPEVKSGLSNIISSVKKHAEQKEHLNRLASSGDMPDASIKKPNPYIVSIDPPERKVYSQKKRILYKKNPYAVAWPKDAPFYLPWHIRIFKYLEFMFK